MPVTSLSLHPIAVADGSECSLRLSTSYLAVNSTADTFYFRYFPEHRWVSLAVVIALVPLAKYCWMGWLLWAVVLWLTSLHPSIPSRREISTGRNWLAVLAIVMLVLSFTPAPLTGASGRKMAWHA